MPWNRPTAVTVRRGILLGYSAVSGLDLVSRLRARRSHATAHGNPWSLVTSNSGADDTKRPERVGASVPFCRLRIADAAGIDVAPGEPGEV